MSSQGLQRVIFTFGQIGTDGAAAIIRGIAVNNQNTQLQILWIIINNITRLPAKLAQLPPTLIEFRYYGNPIDYIPPNVQRWLGRFQRNQNAQIHRDSQNIHNRQIQQCIKDSLYKIINATDRPKYQSFEEIQNFIVNDILFFLQNVKTN